MKDVSPAAGYAAIYPRLAEAGREVGYALAIHGSLARDLDLVAIPWTEEAASAEQFIMRILAVTAGHLCDGGRQVDGQLVRERGDLPGRKPHGRVAYTIFLGEGRYLDVSVMPRTAGAAP